MSIIEMPDELSAARQRIAELEKEIRMQRAKLENVVLNMPDALVVFKRDGSVDMLNAAAMNSLRELNLNPGATGDIQKYVRFYDAEDKLVPLMEVPPMRIARGETLNNFRTKLRYAHESKYFDFSGRPVIDENGDISYTVMCFRDVTPLVDSEKQFAALFSAMQSGVVQYDAEGMVISMNPAAESILGMQAAEFVGSSVNEPRLTIKEDGTVFPHEDYPVLKAVRTGKPIQDITVGIFNPVKKECRWLSINAVPLFRPGDENPYQVFAVFDDITEQKKAQDALKKSEETLRLVLDNSGDFIYSLNVKTNTYEYVSPVSERVLGCTREAFAATDAVSFLNSVHPDDRPVFEAADMVLEDKNETEIRFRQRVKSGEYRWFSNHLTVIRDADGSVIYRNGRIRDITEQNQREEVIRYQAGLLQNISDMIISTDENLIISSWNKAAELKYGWTEAEAVGQNVRTLLKSELIGATFDEYMDQLCGENRFESEIIHTCKDGRKINTLCTIEALRNSKGEVTGTIGIFHDITERKKMEDALKKSEALLRAVIENSSDVTYCYNVQTNKYEYISTACEKVLGFTIDELKEMDLDTTHTLVHPDDRDIFGAELERQLQEKGLEEIQYRQMTKRGEYRWLSNHLTVIKDTNGRVLYRNGRIRDITEKVKSDEAIRYQASLMRNIADMIVCTDENLIINNWNKAAELKYGWTEAEAVGQHVRTLLQVDPVGMSFDERVNEIITKGRVASEVLHTCRDGRKLNALSAVEAIKDSKGNLVGTIGIFHDITERRKMEDAIARQNLILRTINDFYEKSFEYDDLLKLGHVYMKMIETAMDSQASFILECGSDGLLYDLTADSQAHVWKLTRRAEEMDLPAGLMIRELLRVLESGKSLLMNDLSSFMEALIIPKDHPEVKSFICVPYFREGKLLGVLGAVNHPGGYSPEDQEMLEAFTPTIIEVLLRKRMAIQLGEAKARAEYQTKQLNAVIDNMHDALLVFDRNRRIILLNAQARKMYPDLDYQSTVSSVLSGYPCFDLAHRPISVDGLPSRRVFKGEVIRNETILINYPDAARYIEVNATPVFNNDGQLDFAVVNHHDVTEHVQMENALRESELQMRLAAEGAKLGTYAFDFIRHSVFHSDELKVLWGLEPDEPVELDDQLFFTGLHPDDRQRFFENVARANDVNGDGMIETDYRVILKDGTVKWLHTRGLTIFGDIGGVRQPIYASGVVIDITERVAAENSIRELSNELSNIIESTEDYIGSVDRDYRFILFNSAYSNFMERRFGCHLEKGAKLTDLIPPEYASVWADLFERTVTDGKFQIEMRIDNDAHVMSYSFNPVYSNSRVVEITVFGRDITDRLRSEREIIRLNASLEKRVQERTNELQKSISDLQNLSRIISHDLKEPIRQIEYHVVRISEQDKSAAIRQDITDIKKTCGKMTRLIEGLTKYTMSSEQKIKKEKLNVKKMLTSIYNDLKKSSPNATVLQFETGLPMVCADKVLMEHVLHNLLSNALKFSSKRPVSEITAGCMEENYHYVFYIRDNGVGFDMQYAHKLFGVFERLHHEEGYEGSGIGLAAVRNIIRRHGGNTWIESHEGTGTTVYFSLPIENIREQTPFT